MPGFEVFGDAERREVQDVLDNGVLMRYGFDAMRKGHWKAKSLELELSRILEVNHVQLVSSGTAAVSVALAAAGVGYGDEVIMPSFTFVASFEAILMLGAIPVLVDIDDTLTLDPKSVESAITGNTKAVMVVQMCGSMGRMNALRSICEKYDLAFVEDACQAIGGTYQGKPLGSIADLGCFSFDFVKTMTCGEGGAVVTNSEKYYLCADHYSDHGHDHKGDNRGLERHPFLGYNFRISELHAAVGLAQVGRLKEFVGTQQRYHQILKEAIAPLDGVTMRTVPQGGVESGAFINFFLPDLEKARTVSSEFTKQGIDGCFHYFDNNWHYVRKWEHLKTATSLNSLSPEVKNALKLLQTKDFSQSDHFIGRNLSCLIKLSWTEEEVQRRARKMAEIIRAVLGK
jgi:8-amino-3,8-dideoxy-alpha-D-manno-octulosonate transaminase